MLYCIEGIANDDPTHRMGNDIDALILRGVGIKDVPSKQAREVSDVLVIGTVARRCSVNIGTMGLSSAGMQVAIASHILLIIFDGIHFSLPLYRFAQNLVGSLEVVDQGAEAVCPVAGEALP